MNLATVAFLDCMLVHFGALAKVLTNQRREFFNVFEEFCTRALIDYCNTLRDHQEANCLANGLFGQPNMT